MFGAAAKALAQCFTRPFLATLAKAFVVTLALLVALSFGLIKAAHLVPALPWHFANTVLHVLVGAGAVFASFLLIGPVAMIVIGFFLDEIAAKVEQRYYPNLGPPRQIPIAELVATGAGLTILSLAVNLVALPIYLLLPGLNLALYLVINGSFIGREYYVLVAARRLAPLSSRALRRQHRAEVFLAGGLIALVLVIPGVNFVGPLFVTALMVHLVERLRARGSAVAANGASPARAVALDGDDGMR